MKQCSGVLLINQLLLRTGFVKLSQPSYVYQKSLILHCVLLNCFEFSQKGWASYTEAWPLTEVGDSHIEFGHLTDRLGLSQREWAYYKGRRFSEKDVASRKEAHGL